MVSCKRTPKRNGTRSVPSRPNEDGESHLDLPSKLGWEGLPLAEAGRVTAERRVSSGIEVAAGSFVLPSTSFKMPSKMTSDVACSDGVEIVEGAV